MKSAQSALAIPIPQPAATAAKPRIFLIDAMSFIFRAYHAMQRQRPMSTKTGIPTAATYVFVNMLNKLRKDFHPEYLAAIFDVAAPTFRDAQAARLTSVRKFNIKTQQFEAVQYGGYKANRVEMPHDLAQQLPYIRRALEAYRIPILQQEGFEADDVIGTLARKAKDQGHPVYVVSSDKDMMQLVEADICILNPTKDNLICDAAKVEEILGVRPEQVIDVMALRGDSIDNIPGAPGIGDKGSVELIRRFGSVEAALEHAEEVERKTYRESLCNNRETIMLSKELVTIDKNVPVEFRPEEMKAQPPIVEACRELFNELEFTTLLKELAVESDIGETDYRSATKPTDLSQVLKQAAASTMAIALQRSSAIMTLKEQDELAEETLNQLTLAPPSLSTGISTSPLNVAVSAEEGKAVSIHLRDDEIGKVLKSALSDASLPKCIHDFKAALRQLGPRDIHIAGVRDDVMLYSYLINPTYTGHTLSDVSLRQLNLKPTGSLPEAADLTFRLTRRLREEVEANGLMQVYQDIDLPLVPVLARMEEAGVKIDCDVLVGMSKNLERECNSKAKEIHEKSGHEFNINSPKQLGDVLFNKMGLPKPQKYGKGKVVSTAVDVLEELAQEHEVPRLVLEYRQLSKLKSTYVDALPLLLNSCTRRLHTNFNQVGTATGRLSSTNPNLQNIPIKTALGREIRAAFIAEKGHVLLSADYSQIELRLLAHFSGDRLLVSAFRNNEDIHTLTASEVFGVPPLSMDKETRNRAKAVNFGIVYGISPFGLAQQLGIEQKTAKQYIETYFARYSGVRQHIQQCLEEIRREQKAKTLFGRTRPIPDINSKNANMRGFAERTAINTPLQGTAADLIKLAMIRIDQLLRQQKLKTRMLLQVHDELLFEVPEDEVERVKPMIRENMEDVYRLQVPVVVDIGVGPNWRDLN